MVRVALLVIALTATLRAAAPADESALRAARTAQNKAIASGDLDRAAMFWTEDVTVRRALGQSLSGRDAARKALEPPSPPAAHDLSALTKDIESQPEVAAGVRDWRVGRDISTRSPGRSCSAVATRRSGSSAATVG
jgi:ketosteroid isomerase-like protein